MNPQDLSRALKMSSERSPILIRCFRSDSWIRRDRSAAQDDHDGRFIFYWIAFNALYGQPRYLRGESRRSRPGEGELSDITRFLDVILGLSEAAIIREKLSDLKLKMDRDEIVNDVFLSKECWEEWHKRGLVKADERVKHAPLFDRKHKDPVHELFRRLYVLRNQVFHGCSADGSTKNREAIRRAAHILSAMVPLFVEVLRSNSEHPDVKNLLGDLPYLPSVGGTG